MSEQVVIGVSKIPDANLGIFARHDIGSSVYLGKYRGELLKSNGRKRLANYDYSNWTVHPSMAAVALMHPIRLSQTGLGI